MAAQPKTRQVHRERKAPPSQPPRGAKQIVIPMTRPQYDATWHQADRVRAYLTGWAEAAPELFPAGFDQGYCLHGMGRESHKLPGVRLRKIVIADGTAYWLRPSFVTSYLTGTVEELAYPLLLAAHGVPPWLLTLGALVCGPTPRLLRARPSGPTSITASPARARPSRAAGRPSPSSPTSPSRTPPP